MLGCLFGVLAFLVEFVRVEPTFGVGLSIWLFFPLAALALYGAAVGVLSALAAACLLLLFGQNIFSFFDAALFVYTVAISAWVVLRTKQARFVDGVILSWLLAIPAYVLYHQNLMRHDGAALFEVLSMRLMSQLIPAMAVQWLAIRPHPLAPLFPALQKHKDLQSMKLSSVSRAFQLPVLLLTLLFSIDFFTTRELYIRHELQQEKGLLTGRLALQETEDFVEEQLSDPQEAWASNPARSISDNLASNGIGLGANLHVELREEPLTPASAGGPIIVPSTNDLRPIRSPIDSIYHRDWLAQLPVTLGGKVVYVTLQQKVSTHTKSDMQPLIWGLLAVFAFMFALLVAYRVWVKRLGKNLNTILEQFTQWIPGHRLELAQPLLRGVVAEFDIGRDTLQRLINRSNKDHEELTEANRELQRVLKELTLLRSFVNVCASCEKVRVDAAEEDVPPEWVSLQDYVQRTSNVQLSHGYCPVCYQQTMDELRKQQVESQDPT